MEQFSEIIARELNLKPKQVAATLALFEDRATVPFIARYRKEATGMLDETQITAVRDRFSQLEELEKRRNTILVSLTERSLLNDELNRKIMGADNLTLLEDIYLPYRPKRRTKSTIAKEKGLEPLAKAIFAHDSKPLQPDNFINPAKEVRTREDALAGARDIIAEWINEEAGTRAKLRKLFAQEAVIKSSVVKKKEESGSKFRDYFD